MSPRDSNLTPPRISSIIGNCDTFQLSKEVEDIVLEKSRAYWYQIASIAHPFLEHGLAPEFANPKLALCKVPKFQGKLKLQPGWLLGITAIFALCAPASSTWTLPGNSSCEAIKTETTLHARIQIGTRQAIPYKLCGKAFRNWIGTTMENATCPNYLGILAIGWSYILSARLVELQGGGATMIYTDSYAGCGEANLLSPPEGAQIVDVGTSDERIVRWWSAILAENEGWKAIMQDGPSGTFVAPWSVTRACETRHIIKQRLHWLPRVQPPLSSDEAFDALYEFAHLHNLGSQFPTALTAAMSFPMHRYYGIDIHLPPASADGGKSISTISDDISQMWLNIKQDLPYYMSLSCSPEVMISTLCGSFWQPDVPCNMASQWLHPIIEEVLCDINAGKCQEMTAVVGAIRRSNLGALWIGAAVSGIAPELLQEVKRGKPPLDPIAFPWTGAPQCFMDYAGSGPYTCEDPEYIARPDVWRLLHLSPNEDDEMSYRYRPSAPWEPCGCSLTRNCALRVTSHLACPRHEYRYDHWNWELDNGEILQDHGYSNSYVSPLTEVGLSVPNVEADKHTYQKKDLDPDRLASEEASIEIFRWFVMGGEGVPPEKIFHDELLEGVRELDDDYEELEETNDEDSQAPMRKDDDRFQTWLDTIC